MKLKVIGGRDKGRNLKGKSHPSLRPTSHKIKEALFNIIPPVSEKRFLDIFAGTGQIGIEALSRGAAHVTFVERERNFVLTLEKNAKKMETSRIIQGDVFKFLKKSKEDPFDFIFADPPYFMSMYEKIFECLAITEILRDNTLLILEHHSSVHLPEEWGEWKRSDERIYGDTFLSFYEMVGKNTVHRVRGIKSSDIQPDDILA